MYSEEMELLQESIENILNRGTSARVHTPHIKAGSEHADNWSRFAGMNGVLRRIGLAALNAKSLSRNPNNLPLVTAQEGDILGLNLCFDVTNQFNETNFEHVVKNAWSRYEKIDWEYQMDNREEKGLPSALVNGSLALIVDRSSDISPDVHYKAMGKREWVHVRFFNMEKSNYIVLSGSVDNYSGTIYESWSLVDRLEELC